MPYVHYYSRKICVFQTIAPWLQHVIDQASPINYNLVWLQRFSLPAKKQSIEERWTRSVRSFVLIHRAIHLMLPDPIRGRIISVGLLSSRAGKLGNALVDALHEVIADPNFRNVHEALLTLLSTASLAQYV